MKFGQVDTAQLRGLTDKVAGVTKEFVGVMIGNDALQEAGDRQQAKASEELRALRKQVEAEGYSQKANVAQAAQRMAQKAKENAG